MLLYIHIPFCTGKCLYCDFYSIVRDDTKINAYLDALAIEAKLIRESGFDGQKISIETIYLGGGTPSSLDVCQLKKVIDIINDNFELDMLKEFTCEANPDTISEEKLILLKDAGVNRISIGAQTFDDNLLRFLGRRHLACHIFRASELVRKFMDNINIDLIFGLPEQSIDNFLFDLKQAACKISANHISCYELMFSEGTKLSQMLQESIISSACEDTLVNMHRYAHSFLSDMGYEHYEISNYAKPSGKCLHNLRYWENAEYIGLGASAAGYINRIQQYKTFECDSPDTSCPRAYDDSCINSTRYKNISDVDRYIYKLTKENTLPIESSETLSAKARAGETAMLALRTSAGIDREKFIIRTGYDPFLLFANQIEKFRNTNLLDIDERTIKLTPEGFLLSNEILREFLL